MEYTPEHTNCRVVVGKTVLVLRILQQHSQLHATMSCIIVSLSVDNNNDRLTAFDPGQPG